MTPQIPSYTPASSLRFGAAGAQACAQRQRSLPASFNAPANDTVHFGQKDDHDHADHTGHDHAAHAGHDHATHTDEAPAPPAAHSHDGEVCTIDHDAEKDFGSWPLKPFRAVGTWFKELIESFINDLRTILKGPQAEEEDHSGHDHGPGGHPH